MTSNQRLFVALGAIAAVLGLIAAVAVAVLVPRYVEREVLRRAAERGIELEIGKLSFSWGLVELERSKARLTGVSSLRVTLDRVEVTLDGTELVRIALEGVTVSAGGSLATLAVELGAWTKRFPKTYELPLEASGVSVEWRPEATEPPWLTVRGASLRRAPPKTTVLAESARVAGSDVGRLGATWTASGASVSLGFGETELERAPLRLDVEPSAEPKVRLTLSPTKLEKLAGPFAIPLPVEGVTANAVVELLFASRDAMAPKSGHAKLELHGYVPPHPVELDGFVFGDVTRFETDLAFEEGLSRVALTNTSVTAGKFTLKGDGSLVRENDAARAKLDLRGALPCDALASAAAESRLSRLLGRAQGKKAGKAAYKVVGGSVAVRVQVDGTTSDLPNAKVARSIGIGCGLKPLTLADLKELGELVLSGDLSKLPEELGKLMPTGPPPIPSGLPPIPSGFPSLKIPSALLPPRPAPSARLAPSAAPSGDAAP